MRRERETREHERLDPKFPSPRRSPERSGRPRGRSGRRSGPAPFQRGGGGGRGGGERGVVSGVGNERAGKTRRDLAEETERRRLRLETGAAFAEPSRRRVRGARHGGFRGVDERIRGASSGRRRSKRLLERGEDVELDALLSLAKTREEFRHDGFEPRLERRGRGGGDGGEDARGAATNFPTRVVVRVAVPVVVVVAVTPVVVVRVHLLPAVRVALVPVVVVVVVVVGVERAQTKRDVDGVRESSRHPRVVPASRREKFNRAETLLAERLAAFLLRRLAQRQQRRHRRVRVASETPPGGFRGRAEEVGVQRRVVASGGGGFLPAVVCARVDVGDGGVRDGG